MGDSKRSGALCRWAVAGLLLLGGVSLTGCQSSISGQTLPNADYQYDDVQYFPKGLEFQHTREAAALSEARAEAMNR